MDTDSSGGDPTPATEDANFLVNMYMQMSRQYRTIIEEAIYTEEQFLEFVRHMDGDVRTQWDSSEHTSRTLRSELESNASEHSKANGIIKNIRQQLDSELRRRGLADQRVKELQDVLNQLRDMLMKNPHGERTMTDQEKKLMETAKKIQSDTGYGGWSSGVRKSEDIDTDRISWDGESEDDGLEDDQEMMDTLAPQQQQQRGGTERISTRRVVVRNSQGEASKFMRVDENSDGDIEIISKTHVRIPESGTVTARTTLQAKPRKSVGFSEPVSSTLNVRRSHSVPRFIEDTDGNRIRRSREEADLRSSDGASVTGSEDVTSIAGDIQYHQGPATVTTTTNNILRRRSKSLGKGLDLRQHRFVTRMFVFAENCSVCKSKIGIASRGKKCRDCQRVCHDRCEGLAPTPCVPAAVVNPAGSKSGGNIFELDKCASEKRPCVPAVVTQCIRYIEERGLQEEGLYRLSGSQNAVNDLKKQYYAAYKRNPRNATIPNLNSVTDVHVVVGFLKNFLMSLNEPLLTYAEWPHFAAAASSVNRSAFLALFDRLPVANRDTLAGMMLHFWNIIHAPAVRMNSINLQKVLAPSLVGYSAPPKDMTEVKINAEYLRQQLIIGKLFDLPRSYWHTLMETNPRHDRDSLRNRTSNAYQNNDSMIEAYDAPDDPYLSSMEGGGTAMGTLAPSTSVSSLTGMTRAFFGMGSNSKVDVKKGNTVPPPRKFQSPAMSD
ncbi:Rac GTPase-activating protein 1 [Hypsibius exemplaris]|uniref:Rac GTPase-activating protein 1 n=1 Tax=Hypsibius exemplaris TaxID=2072580 RepID=A0A9X6RLF9_HYPEX|nr:Rac GTPase-activating protein 1 [Hypsibius exemplaris]